MRPHHGPADRPASPLHELRAELRDLDQRIAETRAAIGSLKEAGKELAKEPTKEPAKEPTKEPAKEPTKEALPAASTAKKAAPTPAPSQAETLTTLLARLVAERAALVHQLTTARTPISALDAIAWEAEQPLHQATTLAHGHLLHIKQVWRARRVLDGRSGLQPAARARAEEADRDLRLGPPRTGLARRGAHRRGGARREPAARPRRLGDRRLRAARDHRRVEQQQDQGTSFGFGLAGGAAAQGEYKGVQMAGMAGHGVGFSTGSG